ncbi:MAG: hypothetical protein A2X07_10050 [Flavobacteria bacterium GWF1_32_7]|nr:MAG: hypothetical protein A2X07_10050 [Flavobacteria bacterium GWF1_32_7]
MFIRHFLYSSLGKVHYSSQKFWNGTLMKRVRLGGALIVADFLPHRDIVLAIAWVTEMHGVSLVWIVLREMHRGVALVLGFLFRCFAFIVFDF